MGVSRRHPWAREFLWKVDAVTKAKFEELWRLAEGLEQDDPAALALQDEMRCLPGYPHGAQLWDVIVLEPTSTTFSFSTNRMN